ncbi:kinase-like domain-containing protein [Lophiotrema nucula]|uniref:Kinase-like domain-containing protein n=1 Tax=Lophiotrema nucula TaxID=690887 RepID=A0A6A5YFV6_9PLEO|nr:kinase-like domain-containing protein [Lophiotrema nucula]
MKPEALEAIFCELEDRLEYGALGSQRFLPHDVLDTVITADRLRVAFSSRLSFGSSSLAKGVAQHARKVFAILSFIGEPESIEDLWRQGLRDEHLPLSTGSDPKTRAKLVTADGKAFSAWKTAAKASDFVATQWLVQAPVFDTTGLHFPLDINCAMPFVDSDEIGGGAYSYVYKCEVHQAHQKGLKVEDGKTYVAVKQFKLNTDPEAFEKERLNLENLKSLQHRHMIRHHATCKADKTYYAIFPWADGGNLWEYWRNSDHKPRTPDLAVWTIRQMLGLARALEALHERNCRHGDLKPENILRFNASTDPILVIGDVGVSRFHTKDTFLRNEQTKTAATTPSYQAPEVDGAANKARSRTYDIWSFGCIALEFAIWYLWDFNSVTSFQQARVAPDKYCYCYEKNKSGDMEVHPKVVEAITSLLGDPRCDEDTPWGRLLILIRDRLLQVDVEKRAKAEELVAKLQDIVDKIEAPGSSTYTGTVAAVPKPEIFRSKEKRPSNHGPKDSVMETSSFAFSGA